MKLDLVIPTKGRHQDLQRGLEILEDLVLTESPRDLEVGVCISDSSASGLPPSFFSDKFPNLTIKYRHAPETRRFVENLRSAVSLSEADYAWLMGDDDYVLPGALPHLYELLKSKPPLVHVNAVLRNTPAGHEHSLIPDSEEREVLNDIPLLRSIEELTYMSCLVFKREILQDPGPWSEAKECEVASHLRFVSIAVAAGNSLATQTPLVAIEKNEEIVAEWNGNWCILIGYEMPRVRDTFLKLRTTSPRRKAIKARGFKHVCQELRMHLILSVFRNSYPLLAEEASRFDHQNSLVVLLKKLFYKVTTPMSVRQLLKKAGTLLDPRCNALS